MVEPEHETRGTGEPVVLIHAGICADWFRALLGRLGIERAHLVGHSSGGNIALQLALDAPGTVGLEAWLDDVEPFVLAGATHLLHLQRPRAVAEALAGFFARHPLRDP